MMAKCENALLNELAHQTAEVGKGFETYCPDCHGARWEISNQETLRCAREAEERNSIIRQPLLTEEKGGIGEEVTQGGD